MQASIQHWKPNQLHAPENALSEPLVCAELGIGWVVLVTGVRCRERAIKQGVCQVLQVHKIAKGACGARSACFESVL